MILRHPILAQSVVAALIVAAAALWLTYSVPAHAGEGICGTASFYAEAHQGKLMANGKPFNMHALTAAMWGPKFGTRYRVTNLKNGKSVDVTITDRGPAKRLKRIIDLSKAAAARIGMIPAGVAKVCAERL